MNFGQSHVSVLRGLYLGTVSPPCRIMFHRRERTFLARLASHPDIYSNVQTGHEC